MVREQARRRGTDRAKQDAADNIGRRLLGRVDNLEAVLKQEQQESLHGIRAQEEEESHEHRVLEDGWRIE
jgi:hypothetical protein